MHDFPPPIEAFARPQAEPPDTRSASRFLWWLIRQQRDVVLAETLVGILWSLPLTLGPWLFGRAVDRGILAGDPHQTVLWVVILVVVTLVGAGSGTVVHTFAVRSWLISLYGTTKLVTNKTTQMGHILTRRLPTGEVLSVASSDSDQFGALMEVLARSASSLVAYLTVAGIVLATSVKLGLVVLIAAPVLVLIAMPLLRPLERRQTVERTRNSDLTSMATDIVAGLRILRGIGGERTFSDNYNRQSQRVRFAGVAAGFWQAIGDGSAVIFSGLFLVVLIWLGARDVLGGALTVGQLVSFLGYGLFMVGPVRTFFEFAQKWVRSLVSARKAIAIFSSEPPWREPDRPAALPAGAAIADDASGFVARPGELTVVVSAVPDDSAALADRLGRYLPDEQSQVSGQLDEGVKGRTARRERARRRAELSRLADQDVQRAASPWGVRVGDVDLADVPLTHVRERILVSDTQSVVFAGTLQEAVDPHARLTRERAEEVLRTAAAEDVYDALPGGWQGRIDERGRGLSGGQRQRVVLARALGMDVETLVLVEPTSAVDAHTEAVIAERVADLRTGRTTVVMTVSPLWLHHADRVVLLVDGQATAAGRHEELIASTAAYRQVVARNLDDPDVPDEVTTPPAPGPAGPGLEHGWQHEADFRLHAGVGVGENDDDGAGRDGRTPAGQERR